jgi:hypothetical protein
MMQKKMNVYESKLDKVDLSEVQYKDLFETLYDSLQSHLVCPLTLEKIDDPVMLPSGQTVEKAFMQDLISKNKRDPFDRNKLCTTIVQNRFAQYVIDTLSKIDKAISEMPKDRKPKSELKDSPVKIDSPKILPWESIPSASMTPILTFSPNGDLQISFSIPSSSLKPSSVENSSPKSSNSNTSKTYTTYRSHKKH